MYGGDVGGEVLHDARHPLRGRRRGPIVLVAPGERFGCDAVGVWLRDAARDHAQRVTTGREGRQNRTKIRLGPAFGIDSLAGHQNFHRCEPATARKSARCRSALSSQSKWVARSRPATRKRSRSAASSHTRRSA